MTAPFQSHKQMTKAMRAALMEYLRLRCKRAGITNAEKVRYRVSLLAHQEMGTADAWKWLLAEFIVAKPETYARLATAPGRRVAPEKPQKSKKVRRQERFAKRSADKPADVFYRSEEWREVRFVALKRAAGCCCLCGRSNRQHGVILHVDHIKPRSRFPLLALDPANLQVLCEDCNLGKGNRDTTDWRPENVIRLVAGNGEAA